MRIRSHVVYVPPCVADLWQPGAACMIVSLLQAIQCDDSMYETTFFSTSISDFITSQIVVPNFLLFSESGDSDSV